MYLEQLWRVHQALVLERHVVFVEVELVLLSEVAHGEVLYARALHVKSVQDQGRNVSFFLGYHIENILCVVREAFRCPTLDALKLKRIRVNIYYFKDFFEVTLQIHILNQESHFDNLIVSI